MSAETDDIIILDIDDPRPANPAIFVPARPPIAMKGYYIELDPSGANELSWDFGATECLPRSNLLARDAQRNAIATNAAELFPGNFERDPDHQRLVRYVEIADREAFWIPCSSTAVFPAARIDIGGYIFERPATASVNDAAAFDLRHLRVASRGMMWNGTTLLEDAVEHCLISTTDYDALTAGARAELRLTSMRAAIRLALLPFAENAEGLDESVASFSIFYR